MSDNYLQRMLALAKQAGTIARKYAPASGATLKGDNSVVTKADKAVSRLVQKSLKDLTASSEHILVDEEDDKRLEYLNEATLKRAKYIWALDPIDGTRAYANGMPHYGFSIGLLKDLKPWLGVVYFPGLNELFYCDGKKAYFVKDAFSSKQKRKQLKFIDQKIDAHSIFLCSEYFFKHFDITQNHFHVIVPACAVVDLCWPALGRSCGCLLKSSLWDFAGSWPIFQSVGLKMRAAATGRILDKISLEIFNPQRPWKLKDFYILSSKRNYPVIKKILKPRPKNH